MSRKEYELVEETITVKPVMVGDTVGTLIQTPTHTIVVVNQQGATPGKRLLAAGITKYRKKDEFNATRGETIATGRIAKHLQRSPLIEVDLGGEGKIEHKIAYFAEKAL
jgi:hypothetical protein